MITTNTGAKKLESGDNWREIFPNPGTGAAGAHNASVDAQDRIQAEVAPIINGKRCSVGAASGEYVLLRNSTITGKADGAYQAAKAIPANTDLDSTYLGSPITGGLVNELNSNITTLSDNLTAIKEYNVNTTGFNGNYGTGYCRWVRYGNLVIADITCMDTIMGIGLSGTIAFAPNGFKPKVTNNAQFASWDTTGTKTLVNAFANPDIEIDTNGYVKQAIAGELPVGSAFHIHFVYEAA